MRELFLKDIGWKIFSLLLAAAIWYTVHHILHETNDPSVRTVTYDNLPVTAVSPLANVRAYRLAPLTVKVTVTGPASIMNTLQANDLHASVSLTGASLTRGLLLPVEISPPLKVAVTSIDPDRVLVSVPSTPEKQP